MNENNRRPMSRHLTPTSVFAVLVLLAPVGLTGVGTLAVSPFGLPAPHTAPVLPHPVDAKTAAFLQMLRADAPSERALYSSLSNLTPAELSAAIHAGHLDGTWTAKGAHNYFVHIDANWSFFSCLDLGCYAAFAVTGCGLGALIGFAAGGPVGAGVGCIGGTAGGLLVAIFGFSQASASNNAVELNYIVATTIAYSNSLIFCAGLVEQSFSELNSTFHAWAAMADAVAPNQLPNVTFDPLRALNDSGVAAQLATVLAGIRQAEDAAFFDMDSSIANAYSSAGPFANGCNYYISVISSVFGCTPAGHGSTGPNQWYAHANAAIEGSAVNGTGVTVLAGGFFYANCVSQTNTWINQVGGTTQVHIVANNVPVLLAQNANYAGTYRFHIVGGGGTCDLLGAGFVMDPTAGVGSPSTQVTLVVCGSQQIVNTCNPTNLSSSGWGKFNFAFTFQAFSISPSVGISLVYSADGTPASFKTELNSIMTTATTEATAYWTFLHLLGYTNVNQIPSNCIIPTPDQILPPQYSQGLGTLTLNQTLSLYAAWLNALAVFFNTPQNASTFCAGHSVFHVGFASWNINVITTGFVFTLPPANQNFGTLSTWTVTNATQTATEVGNKSRHGLRTDPAPIVLWPTVKTLNVKVGKVQEVPVDNPLDVFSPNNGTLYLLTGNGTAENGAGWSNGTTSTSKGAAIYISSCLVLQPSGQYVTANGGICPLALSSIKNVSFAGTSGFPAPVTNVASACGQTGFFGNLVQLWDQVFLSLPFNLGCPVALLAAIVTLIVIVVLVVYAIVWVARGVEARREE